MESGLVQTGVAYPNCSNVNRTGNFRVEGPFAVESIDSSVIEFFGSRSGFGTENYTLVKVIVVDERILERFYNQN